MTSHSIHQLWLLGLLLLALSLTGCSRGRQSQVLAQSAVDRFPTGEVLREGDIILGRSYGVIGTVFAQFGARPGKYSHAALYFRDRDGRGRVLNIRPFGMDVCPPEEYYTRYNRLALVRYNGKVKGVSKSARTWIARNQIARIPPDYELDRKNHDELFCLELLSVAYTENGLPDPFAEATPVDKNPVAQYFLKHVNVSVTEIPSANSVLYTPGFKEIAAWLRPDYDPREEILHNTLVKSLASYFEQGLTVRPPRLGGRIKIRLILALFHLKRLFSPYRRYTSIPAFIGQRCVDVGYMLHEHVSYTKRDARRAFDRELGENWTRAQVEAITRRVSDQYRDRFFYPPSAQAAASGVGGAGQSADCRVQGAK